MKLPTIKKNYEKEFKNFVEYWSKLYYYNLSDKYDSRINNQTFSEDDLYELYFWKNGMKLSGPKLKSFNNKILKKIKIINEYKLNEKFDTKEFFIEFKDVSFVWKIFLLHIIKPKKYPIYDQHIHRTYLYINKLKWDNITANIRDKDKSTFYLDKYMPFIAKQNRMKIKNIDEAMFTFGKFLNTENQYQIF